MRSQTMIQHASYRQQNPFLYSPFLLAIAICVFSIFVHETNGFAIVPSQITTKSPLWIQQQNEPFHPHRSNDKIRKSSSLPSTKDTEASTSIQQTTQTSPSSSTTISQSQRTIASTEKFSRLPVWPIWNGILLFVLSKLFGQEVAAKWEDELPLGGRVCPNFFNAERTNPFIMLVHHKHSFAQWDLVRFVQRVVFPEGFPAHPHRGFITVTYILKGGFVHRDSLGIKQTYGAEKRYNGKHTQWLTAGAGILHEEMWDIKPSNFFAPAEQELYQLWVNLPARDKMTNPKVQLLGGEEETPTVITTTDSANNDREEIDDSNIATKTIIIAGEHAGKKGSVVTQSDLSILHVQIMKADTIWTHLIPESHRTAVIYVRRGSIYVGDERVPAHHTAYLTPHGANLSIKSDPNSSSMADFLLLTGEPINEPIMPQGSMVMNYPDEINQAYQDYQSGKMGIPWDHTLNDEDWKVHTEQYPSLYK